MDSLNLRRRGVIGRRGSSLGVLVVLPLGERSQVERHRNFAHGKIDETKNSLGFWQLQVVEHSKKEEAEKFIQ